MSAAVLLGLALGLGVQRVKAEPVGVIEGRIQNSTAGAAEVANALVILHIVGADERVERRQTATDQSGYFSFRNLETAAELKYLPTVEYQGALYFPRVLNLSDQPSQTADITVYEGTASDRMIAFERSNMLIQSIEPKRIDLMEMGAIANVGDRTFLGQEVPSGSDRPTLVFAVPPGATDLAPRSGMPPGDLTSTAEGFSLSSPVVPGRHQLAYSYSLGYDADRLTIEKRLTYPAASFNLYVPDIGLRVSSDDLEARGPTELGGQRFLVFSGQNLSRGTELRIEITNLPVAANGPGEALAVPVLGAGSAGLAAGLVLVFRRRRSANLAGSGSEMLGHDRVERTQVLMKLVSLDDRYARGELDVESYLRQRSVEKQRLAGLGEPAASGGRG